MTLKQRLRYRFDNLMARGIVGQMLMLALLSVASITGGALFLLLTGIAPADESGTTPNFAMLMWMTLMRSMDAGAVGGDTGSWPYLFLMLAVTLGGIFVLSTLIGVLNSAIGGVLDELRKGRSLVAEQDHTIILGWTPKIHMILQELAIANEGKPNACVVVLADRDKVEMDDEIRNELGDRKLRVVSRSGSPYSRLDLEIVNPDAARAIILLSPEGEVSPNEADTVVLKAMLAVSKLPSFASGKLHMVAEIKEDRTYDVARMIAGPAAALVLSPPLVSRLLVQTGRQSGLSAVYTELLGFEGNEIYAVSAQGLTGTSFRDALSAYDDSALIGAIDASGALLLPPEMDRPFAPGDRAVLISASESQIALNGQSDATMPPSPQSGPSSSKAERTLVLGASQRLPMVLRELDAYVQSGSEALVVGESSTEERPVLANLSVEYREGDITDRRLLDSLQVSSFDHILVLSETSARSQDIADARTMVTLLHLRDISRRSSVTVPVTSEMLDIRNQELASVAEADDFIISNTLIALVLAQLSVNPFLVGVYDELFSPRGYEIYLKPANQYVSPDVEVDFYGLLLATAARNEIAIGYRLAAAARNPKEGYGVILNPRKRERFRLGAQDNVIVLAAN